MIRKHMGVLSLLLLWPLTPNAVAVDGFDRLDAEACRALVDEQAIMPMSKIMARAEVLAKGEILDAVLLKRAPLFIYQIELLGTDGVVRTHYFDAITGRETPAFNNGVSNADSAR